MVSPRIWVSCTVAHDSQQEMILAQQIISDLHKAGADVVTENTSVSDAPFLAFLQQEFSRCQWFLLVLTPQARNSRRAQIAIQEALQRIKGGSLSGILVTWSSSDSWDLPMSWSAMQSYAYNGDYPRLRDKLLLDLNLLRIEDLSEDEGEDVTVLRFPPRKRPVLSQKTAEEKQPMPAQKGNKRLNTLLNKLPVPFRLPEIHLPELSVRLPQIDGLLSKRQSNIKSGDRPATPPLFSISSPRLWLYSGISIFCILLIILTVVLTRGMSSVLPSFASTSATPVSSPTLVLPRPASSQSPSSLLTPITVQDAGYVFITTGLAPVLDQTGKPVEARCSKQAATAAVSAGQNVVALDNHAFQMAGQTYLHVAYPDPCILGLDFSSNAAIANGTGAVGWVALNALAVTHVVRPMPEFKGGSIWRDCWTPDHCANVGYSNMTDTLSAKDTVLLAWWTGSYWDVHWWHVHDKNGKDASVYARDWAAYSQ